MKTEERFWAKVEKTETCWLWAASQRGGGYGQFRAGGSMVLAHRWAYENAAGSIPEGLELDHLCRNRLCVRPDHLEIVTHRENVRRGQSGPVNAARMSAKTHCPQGHAYDEANTRVYRGARFCRACQHAWDESRRR